MKLSIKNSLNVFEFIPIVMWVAGFVIASGVRETFLCIIPPYAWYLVIERVMIFNGWL